MAPENLHVSLARVHGTPTETVGVREALDEALSGLPRPVGPWPATAAATPFGLLLHGEHDQVSDLKDRAGRVSTPALRAESAPGGGCWHMATAYTRAHGPGRALAQAVDGAVVAVRPAALVLALVHQHPDVPAYTWQTLASWDLQGS